MHPFRVKTKSKVYPKYSLVENTVLQNNEIGLHTSYSTRIRFKDMRIDADRQLKRHALSDADFEDVAATGIEMNHFSNSNHGLHDVVVRGYPVCERSRLNEATFFAERHGVTLEECTQETVKWDSETIKKRRR